MRSTPRSSSALALGAVVGLTALLAGCGELVVLNPGSVASCAVDGDSVILTTSQDSAGDELTIAYEGPSDLAVVFSYGYSIEDVSEAAATGAYAYSQSSSNSAPPGTTAYLLRLDPANDPGWTANESGGILDATFTGTVDQLLNGRNAYLATNGGTAIAEVASAFIAVSCDSDLASGEVETVDSNAGLAPDLLLAAAVNPDTVRIGPFEIITQTTVAGVTTGTLRFADDAAAAFAGFVPSTIAESSVVSDIADVPDDTFSQLWFQEFRRGASTSGSFSIASPLTLDGPMNFTFTADAAPDNLPEGLHRLRLVLGNTDLFAPDAQFESASNELDAQSIRELDATDFTSAAAGDAKAVFFTVEYDETSGLLFGAALPADPPAAPQPELADTGAELNAAAVAFAALLVVGGGALLVGRRRARRA